MPIITLPLFCIQVQSSNSSVEHLSSRVSAFIGAFRSSLDALKAEDVAAKSAVLASQLLESDKIQSDESGRLWSPLRSGTFEFHNTEACAAVVRSLTLADIVTLWDACIAPGAPLLRKITAGVYASPSKPEGKGAEETRGGAEAGSSAPVSSDAVISHGGGPTAVPSGVGVVSPSAAEVRLLRERCWRVPPPHELARRWADVTVCRQEVSYGQQGITSSAPPASGEPGEEK
jgi:hypothetical protein